METAKPVSPAEGRTKRTTRAAVNVALSASFALLSVYLIVRYEVWTVALTAVVSFAVALVFLRKSGFARLSTLKARPLATALSAALSLMLLTAAHSQKNAAGAPGSPLPASFFRYRVAVLALPAVFALLLLVSRRLAVFAEEMRGIIKGPDCKLYAALSAATSAAILFAYLAEPRFYTQYDLVYSLDSGFCFTELFPKIGYYDVRHPVLGLFTFPLYTAVRRCADILLPAPLAEPVAAAALQALNVQCMLLVGFILKHLSRRRAVALLYFCSAPFFLFTLFFEKFQICTLLLVYCAFRLCEGGSASLACAASAGAMATNIILGGGGGAGYGQAVPPKNREPAPYRLRRTASPHMLRPGTPAKPA